MKDFYDYQERAMRTNGQGNRKHEEQLLYGALAITGEAGELADAIKKTLFHGHTLDREKLLLEMGDVLWGLAFLAQVLDSNLGAVAALNIDKLAKRYPERFSVEASMARADISPSEDASTYPSKLYGAHIWASFDTAAGGSASFCRRCGVEETTSHKGCFT